MKAFIYVISNRIIPDMVKIGLCDEHPETIVRYLDSTGASPIAFKLEYKVFLNDCYPILQNARRELWSQIKNVGQGWFYIAAEAAIEIIRHQVASSIIDKFKQEILSGCGDNDFPTIMRIIDSVLILTGDANLSRKNDVTEAMEIAKHIVTIMKNENWLQKDRWFSRLTHHTSKNPH